MSSGLIDTIKQTSINAYHASAPAEILHGTIVSASPLKVKINDEISLDEDFLKLNGTVMDNDKVVLIRQQGGQKYVILGTLTDTIVDTEYVYLGGDEGSDTNTRQATTGWKFPISGTYRITSRFGYRIHPISGKRKMHSGIDISGAHDKRIYPAKSGIVKKVQSIKTGYGNNIIIDHGNNITTRYAHLKTMYVKEGQKVSNGTAIGYMGTTGSSTGVHLHFEIRLSDRPTDPIKYLKDRGVTV